MIHSLLYYTVYNYDDINGWLYYNTMGSHFNIKTWSFHVYFFIYISYLRFIIQESVTDIQK